MSSANKSEPVNREHDVKQILDAIAAEIRETDARRVALEGLLKQIQSCDTECFTNEEISATRAEIDTCLAVSEAKRTMLDEKIHIYEDRVLLLEQKLAARKKIIESSRDDTSSEFTLQKAPELLNLFVQQHANMTNELDQARTELMTK